MRQLVNEGKEEAYRYFGKAYLDEAIEELNELVFFYDDAGESVYKDLSNTCFNKAIDMFKKLNTQKQIDFIKSMQSLNFLMNVVQFLTIYYTNGLELLRSPTFADRTIYRHVG